MTSETQQWLPGWELVQLADQAPCDDYPEECRWIGAVGSMLFEFGAIRGYEGLQVPERYREGTSGNLAAKIPWDERGLCEIGRASCRERVYVLV